MNVVVIGHSRVVRKRVLPALHVLADQGRVGRPVVASRGAAEVASFTGDRAYVDALDTIGSGLAYVSLPNALHGEWVKAALERGFHVVVDKPAFGTVAEAESMVGLAGARGVVLAEATVWAHHPICQTMLDVFEQAGTAPTRVTATFSFPPLSTDDFRYRADLGGGSLYDVGPYAVSAGRVLFGCAPLAVECHVHSWSATTPLVDTSFSVLARYGRGRALVGHFGFTTEYRNDLVVFGPGASVEVDWVFSMPSAVTPRLEVRTRDQRRAVMAPRADSFVCFLADVVDAVDSGATRHAEALLADAAALATARSAAGLGP